MPATTNSRELRIVMGGAKDDVQLGHDPVRNGGPYHVVAFEPECSMQLEASLTHWAGRPRLERITITVDADLNAQAAALEGGDADLICAFPPENIDRLGRFASGYDVYSAPSMRALSIQINTGQPPFDDLRVRKATSLAIDREALVSDVLGGHGAVAT